MEKIEILEVFSIKGYEAELADLLIKVVEEGASIGFLPPLDRPEAEGYWAGIIKSDDVILFLARMDGKVVGSVQLHLCTKQNGSHRAEIAKLMTDTTIRRKGIGRLLMQTAEEKAKRVGRTLLVLDTREGDPSNDLYRSIGYIKAGKIPGYAQSAGGELDATVLYYKNV
ncbi:GNAT family N-acetyltransferase [Bacillus sp. ISL-47]|uniref:GNAT family N-acetyltransferase n=1 Tax=Bacillus sp. ISL-47 TaxID=2819130 RepID=UPI001BE9DC6D|nr:GNAT family N-acetyltransferase [Bacillus sp. ISL-47]MBT2690587.1 GNAT family N-acetyltransferase [Bacillus sp. ISL-47]MBT2708157.1 GNAT family N-acetyltransferase [Pseudomonas sp. ISL-84]